MPRYPRPPNYSGGPAPYRRRNTSSSVDYNTSSAGWAELDRTRPDSYAGQNAAFEATRFDAASYGPAPDYGAPATRQGTHPASMATVEGELVRKENLPDTRRMKWTKASKKAARKAFRLARRLHPALRWIDWINGLVSTLPEMRTPAGYYVPAGSNWTRCGTLAAACTTVPERMSFRANIGASCPSSTNPDCRVLQACSQPQHPLGTTIPSNIGVVYFETVCVGSTPRMTIVSSWRRPATSPSVYDPQWRPGSTIVNEPDPNVWRRRRRAPLSNPWPDENPTPRPMPKPAAIVITSNRFPSPAPTNAVGPRGTTGPRGRPIDLPAPGTMPLPRPGPGRLPPETLPPTGSAPPEPHTRERKGRAARWGALFADILDGVSEAAEIVSALFDALPDDVRKRWKCGKKHRTKFQQAGDQMGQYGLDGADCKMQALYWNWHRLDVDEAITNVLLNEIEDRLYGAAHGARDRIRPRRGATWAGPQRRR